MGAERDLEIFGMEGGDAFFVGLGTLADDARPEIDQIGVPIDHHGGGRAAGERLRVGRAGTQQNKLCLTHTESLTIVQFYPVQYTKVEHFRPAILLGC